ncbi:MAG: mechanosensitive ion channel family protein [Candidatus Nealsonbacteria bacterium]
MIQEVITLVWQNIVEVSPAIIGGILLLLFGFIIAGSLKRLAIAFLKRIRLNQVLRRLGLDDTLSKIDVRFDASNFFGDVVKWFFIFVFLMASSEVIGLTQFSRFLERVIEYFPNIFIAFLMFVVAAFIADFSKKIVVGTLEKERIIYSKFLGRSIHWAIWFFALLAILYQLQITPSLILVIFIGMVAALSISVGIAFGLGGKDLASRILKELEEKFK